MNIRTTVVLLFALSGATSSLGATVDFRGVPLGSSEEAFRERLPSFNCEDIPAKFRALADRVCRPGNHAEDKGFGGVDASSIAAHFAGDRFTSLVVRIKPGQFDTVSAALKAKFGPPTSTETPELRTQGGLTASNVILLWDFPSSQVRAAKFDRSITEATVAYIDKKGLRDFTERNKKSAKDNAKSL